MCRRLRDDFVAGTVKTTQELDNRAISGRARLLAPGRLEVNGRELHAHNIIIATGSSPVVPEPWSALGERLLTTELYLNRQRYPLGGIGSGAGRYRNGTSAFPARH